MARIRELTQKDIPETVQILAASEPVFRKGEEREDVQKLLQSAIGRAIVYVAEEESQVAAVVYFIPEPIFAHGGYIRFLAVRPELRRRGIGRQLMGFVERKIFSQSSNAYVSVSLSNESARRFCEKLGYEKIGEVPDLLDDGDKEWILRKKARSDARRYPRSSPPPDPAHARTSPKVPRSQSTFPRQTED
jgi:ribosomal protein S18 acetylase RimI-like enzyme